MGIVKHEAPLATSPSTFVSQALDYINALVRDKEPLERIEAGYIKQGSRFSIGGVLYICDSDIAISGTASATTLAVKITPSGSAATPSYVDDLTGVSWNASYQGYYDSSGNLYLKVPSVGVYTKYSAANDINIKIEKDGTYTFRWNVGYSTGETATNHTVTTQVYRNGSVYGSLNTYTIYAAGSGSSTLSENLWLQRGDIVKFVRTLTTYASCSNVFIGTDEYGVSFE